MDRIEYLHLKGFICDNDVYSCERCIIKVDDKLVRPCHYLAQCTSPVEDGYAHVDSEFFLALKRNKDFLDKCRASKPFTYAKLRKYFGRATLV